MPTKWSNPFHIQDTKPGTNQGTKFSNFQTRSFSPNRHMQATGGCFCVSISLAIH